MSSDLERYNLRWDRDTYWDDALIERYMLQQGGQWSQNGTTFGRGLEFHFKEYWKLLWPED